MEDEFCFSLEDVKSALSQDDEDCQSVSSAGEGREIYLLETTSVSTLGDDEQDGRMVIEF